MRKNSFSRHHVINTQIGLNQFLYENMNIQPRLVQQYLVNVALFFYLQVHGFEVCHFQITAERFVRVLVREIFEDRKVIFVNPIFLFLAAGLFVLTELHFHIL